MLSLFGITKIYDTGGEKVAALKGVDMHFRRHEFVSILGPSGCGKTTMLNIVGGLDQYTDGDMLIDGISTKNYTDRDWDAYRNHRIGFVFQSYQLITHQTVLANVELALTLSGVSKAERRRRATEALEKVGLGDQLKKKPGQMSGGQMQRVAIARALVNNPEILLADEPTGALDTQTSQQVMDLLKEIAKDKLVIMVTHNPELAEQYSTRIIRLRDGVMISDSHPYTAEEAMSEVAEHQAQMAEKQPDDTHPYGCHYWCRSCSCISPIYKYNLFRNSVCRRIESCSTYTCIYFGHLFNFQSTRRFRQEVPQGYCSLYNVHIYCGNIGGVSRQDIPCEHSAFRYCRGKQCRSRSIGRGIPQYR